MDKEERQNLQKWVHRVESTGFRFPPGRKLASLDGGEWKRDQGWERSMVRGRGEIQTLRKPNHKITKLWDPNPKPSLCNNSTKGNTMEELKRFRTIRRTKGGMGGIRFSAQIQLYSFIRWEDRQASMD